MSQKHTLLRLAATLLAIAAATAAVPAASLAGDPGGGPTPTAPTHP